MADKKRGIPPTPTSDDRQTAHTRLRDALREFVQVEGEDKNTPLGRDLVKIAEEEGVNILAFMAPEIGVKVSPMRYASAQIGLVEEFGLQRALTEMRDIDPAMQQKPLWLLVHSPGGYIPSSYMIAKRLRTIFEEIVTFVPHVAASGGTLIALSGNEVVMSDFSRLGPLDPQVQYSPGVECDFVQVSANCMERAITSLEESLKTISESDLTVPSRRLTAKLDPILRENWRAELFAVACYVQEILSKSDYEQKNINLVIQNLVFTSYPHDFVVDKDRAVEYGVSVSKSADKMGHLEIMQEWLMKYMLEREFRHYIRFVSIPKKEVPNETSTKGVNEAASGK